MFVESAEMSLFETALTVRTPVGSFDAITVSVGADEVQTTTTLVA